jgi:hypothetical protein
VIVQGAAQLHHALHQRILGYERVGPQRVNQLFLAISLPRFSST